jgi:hypothetical protein
MPVKLQQDAASLMHYTYLHRRASDGMPFYIGKGSGRRAFSKVSRSQFWHSTAKKHGLSVEICAQWPTEEEAYQHERFLIECFEGMGFRLCNLTKGGDGLREPTPEVRARMSASQKKRMASPKTRALMSKAHKGVPKSAEHVRKIAAANTGKKRSQEFCDRIRASRLGVPMTPEAIRKSKESRKNAAPVVCIELGRPFFSCSEAARWLCENGHPKAERRSISRAAGGEMKSAYGYTWKFSKDE